MMKMNRRDFMIGVAALTASAALPLNSTKKIKFPRLDLPFVTDAATTQRIAKVHIHEGVFVSVDSYGKNNEYLELGIVISENKTKKSIKLFINNEKVPIDADGNVTKGAFSGLVYLETPWKKEFINGGSYTGINLRLKYDSNKFSNGIPPLRFE